MRYITPVKASPRVWVDPSVQSHWPAAEECLETREQHPHTPSVHCQARKPVLAPQQCVQPFWVPASDAQWKLLAFVAPALPPSPSDAPASSLSSSSLGMQWAGCLPSCLARCSHRQMAWLLSVGLLSQPRQWVGKRGLPYPSIPHRASPMLKLAQVKSLGLDLSYKLFSVTRCIFYVSYLLKLTKQLMNMKKCKEFNISFVACFLYLNLQNSRN